MAFLQAGRGDGPFWGDGRQAILNVPSVVLWLIGVLAVSHGVRVFLPPGLSSAALHLFAFTPQHVAQIHGVDAFSLAAAASFATYMFVHEDASTVAIECLVLLAFGSVVARRFGAWRFLAIFLGGGVAGALLYLATAWDSVGGIIDATGGITAVMLTAIRATWPGQARPTVFPPALAPILSPQVLVTVVLWMSLSFIFAAPVVLPVGTASAVLWQQSAAGVAVGLALSELFDRLMPKISLAGR